MARIEVQRIKYQRKNKKEQVTIEGNSDRLIKLIWFDRILSCLRLLRYLVFYPIVSSDPIQNTIKWLWHLITNSQ